MRFRELIDTALASPFTPEESQVEKAIHHHMALLGARAGEWANHCPLVEESRGSQRP
jgi:hypothetical protein